MGHTFVVVDLFISTPSTVLGTYYYVSSSTSPSNKNKLWIQISRLQFVWINFCLYGCICFAIKIKDSFIFTAVIVFIFLILCVWYVIFLYEFIIFIKIKKNIFNRFLMTKKVTVIYIHFLHPIQSIALLFSNEWAKLTNCWDTIF